MNRRIRWTGQTWPCQAISRFAIFMLLELMGCGLYQTTKDVPTTPGPETPTLLSQLHGTILIDGQCELHGRRERDQVLSLPGLESRNISDYYATEYNCDTREMTVAISGPDQKNRMACIVWRMTRDGGDDNVWFLRFLHTDRPQVHQVAEFHTNESFGPLAISSQSAFALAPRGGLVALVTDWEGAQMDNPPALLERGILSFYDVETDRRLVLQPQTMVDRLSWFPDGRRLAYTDLLARNAALTFQPKAATDSEDITGGKQWAQFPVVHLLDLATSQSTPLVIGREPVVSAEGDRVVFRKLNDRWAIMRLADHSIEHIASGQVYTAVGLIGNLLIFTGPITAGARPQLTTNNSPLVGPKPMLALKVLDLKTGQFQTIVPYVDPRAKYSVNLLPGQAG